MTPPSLHGILAPSRRQFLSQFGMGMGAIGLAALLGPELQAAESSSGTSLQPVAPRTHFPAKAKRVLHIFAQGAPSHVDTWDPKPTLAKYDGRVVDSLDGVAFASPFKFRPRGSSGIEVSEVFPELGEHVDKMTVIRSMHTDIPDHIFATYMMSTGQGRLARPSMGAWVVYGLGSENQNLPGYIALSPGPVPFGAQNLRSAFLPGNCQGTQINTNNSTIEKLIENIRNNYVTGEEQRSQLDLVEKLNKRFQTDEALEARIQSFELAFQMQTEATDAFDIDREPEYIRKQYAAHTPQGRQMLIARRLLEKGVRVVQVWHQGWDHHQDIANVLPKKAAECDRPLAALLDDMQKRGLLDDTLVIWGGEFGRLPRRQLPTADISAATPPGRDHNAKGFCAWLAGGGVKGGQVYGGTDELGYMAVENKVHVHDLHATVLALLGFDHQRLTYRYNGRDFRLTDVFGRVVKEIIA
ncbi:MAG TPA: DUF1501 domain-containing protein [Pirellulales bacterium]|jgi:hypothetical protein|nr:DUF1501 domain-containing protein [Pirellulales bacterium]